MVLSALVWIHKENQCLGILLDTNFVYVFAIRCDSMLETIWIEIYSLFSFISTTIKCVTLHWVLENRRVV
ncbi:MAG: hypothetical protein CL916_13980 [Deltaproteobacteria bacterium]|nr:hypothetical protein [Deltaproteobacteria bacterium]